MAARAASSVSYSEILRRRILCKTDRRIYFAKRGEYLDEKGEPTAGTYPHWPLAPGEPEVGWMSRAGIDGVTGPREIYSFFTSLAEALAARMEAKRERLRQAREVHARAGLQLH
jgi:hypothetical protein